LISPFNSGSFSELCVDRQETKAKEWFEEELEKWNQDIKDLIVQKKSGKRSMGNPIK
jgi:hypothetical protein